MLLNGGRKDQYSVKGLMSIWYIYITIYIGVNIFLACHFCYCNYIVISVWCINNSRISDILGKQRINSRFALSSIHAAYAAGYCRLDVSCSLTGQSEKLISRINSQISDIGRQNEKSFSVCRFLYRLNLLFKIVIIRPIRGIQSVIVHWDIEN